jgi:Arc/MetJ family transcription regulator
MKRTNVVVDEQLLEEAVRVSGERTYSRTIERALEELVRRSKAHTILQLAGSGAWTGDLGEMRGDRATTARESRSVYRTRKRRAAR